MPLSKGANEKAAPAVGIETLLAFDPCSQCESAPAPIVHVLASPVDRTQEVRTQMIARPTSARLRSIHHSIVRVKVLVRHDPLLHFFHHVAVIRNPIIEIGSRGHERFV